MLFVRVFKIEILKISGSALAAEICAGPHNRLLRRQHCSSLCSQSEGHEHVANMTNALGHYFVGFSVLVRHNIRSPHFASKVSYSASPQTLAECSRSAPCCYVATFFLYFEHHAQNITCQRQNYGLLNHRKKFFPSHRLLQAAQFFMRFMRTRVISRVAHRCVLHVWYSLSAYFHHSPYTCQRTPSRVRSRIGLRSIASRPTFGRASARVR